MADYTHNWEYQGRTSTFTGDGTIGGEPARVYALAFDAAGNLLLVSGSPADRLRWLPGGGIEPGETPPEALARELIEEADAIIVALAAIGSQQAYDPWKGSEWHRFFWCRIRLGPQQFPRAESTVRHLVPPDQFLDTLEWGRRDPKAGILLERALAADAHHGR